MDVEVITLTKEAVEKWDYRHYLEIRIDGKKAVRFFDGEPEDATLSRDFNDCYSIPDLMKKAHEAGARGEVLSVTTREVDEP